MITFGEGFASLNPAAAEAVLGNTEGDEEVDREKVEDGEEGAGDGLPAKL